MQVTSVMYLCSIHRALVVLFSVHNTGQNRVAKS